MFVSPTTDLSKKLSFAGVAGTPGRGIIGTGAVPLKVFCRVRPLRPDERAQGPPAISVEQPCTIRVFTGDEAKSLQRIKDDGAGDTAADDAAASPQPGAAPDKPAGTTGAAAAAAAAQSMGSTFTFDRVFDESTSQAELYTGSFRPVVQSAVHRGSGGLLFAYGMTSAGKTYTISGNDSAPGLLPRVLHTVFGEIKAAREREADKAVRRASGSRQAGAHGAAADADAGAGAGADADAAACASAPGDALVTDSLGQRAADSTLCRLTVAVSYLEVYNEGVYDLLSDMSEGTTEPAAGAGGDSEAEAAAARQAAARAKRRGGKGSSAAGAGSAAGGADGAPRRVPLRLKDGRDGRVHVRGLRTVTVPSLSRALEIMQQGAANKRVAETRLNADSSRSHTVFTINLFRHDVAAPEGGAAGGAHADAAEAAAPGGTGTGTGTSGSDGLRLWARLSIVDLAGCERAGRTGASGARLREASNINRSLSALMQCLDTLRHNRKAAAAAAARGAPPPQPRVVPFRESKLTRLFSDALGGNAAGAVAMVVNAGPSASDREETIQALRYGAVAREVRIAPRIAPQGAGGAAAGAGAGAGGGKAPKYGMDGRRLRRAGSGRAAGGGRGGSRGGGGGG